MGFLTIATECTLASQNVTSVNVSRYRCYVRFLAEISRENPPRVRSFTSEQLNSQCQFARVPQNLKVAVFLIAALTLGGCATPRLGVRSTGGQDGCTGVHGCTIDGGAARAVPSGSGLVDSSAGLGLFSSESLTWLCIAAAALVLTAAIFLALTEGL